MSARGTITSAIRLSRSARMFLSIVLSSGEKPVSPGAPASSTTLRSERIEPVFQPNTARSTRANQRSLASRGSPAAGTGTGRFLISPGASGVSLVFAASSGMGMRDLFAHILGRRAGGRPGSRPGQAFGICVVTVGIGIGDAQPRQNPSFAPLHCLGLPERFVIVAQKVEKAMQRQVGNVMVERLGLGARLARHGLVGEHDVAEMAPDAARRG